MDDITDKLAGASQLFSDKQWRSAYEQYLSCVETIVQYLKYLPLNINQEQLTTAQDDASDIAQLFNICHTCLSLAETTFGNFKVPRNAKFPVVRKVKSLAPDQINYSITSSFGGDQAQFTPLKRKFRHRKSQSLSDQVVNLRRSVTSLKDTDEIDSLTKSSSNQLANLVKLLEQSDFVQVEVYNPTDHPDFVSLEQLFIQSSLESLASSAVKSDLVSPRANVPSLTIKQSPIIKESQLLQQSIDEKSMMLLKQQDTNSNIKADFKLSRIITEDLQRIRQQLIELDFIEREYSLENITKLNPSVMALTITAVDQVLFKQLQCKTDFISHSSKVPNINVSRLIDWFNYLSRLVEVTCMLQDQKDRQINSKTSNQQWWIKVASCLQDLQNYNSLKAVISGLTSYNVQQFIPSTKQANKKYQDKLAQLQAIVSENDNYAEYRKVMSQVNPPAIPFFGVVIYDTSYASASKQLVSAQMSDPTPSSPQKTTLAQGLMRRSRQRPVSVSEHRLQEQLFQLQSLQVNTHYEDSDMARKLLPKDVSDNRYQLLKAAHCLLSQKFVTDDQLAQLRQTSNEMNLSSSQTASFKLSSQQQSTSNYTLWSALSASKESIFSRQRRSHSISVAESSKTTFKLQMDNTSTTTQQQDLSNAEQDPSLNLSSSSQISAVSSASLQSPSSQSNVAKSPRQSVSLNARARLKAFTSGGERQRSRTVSDNSRSIAQD
ncbi:hypothetical protein MP228_009222 [Amoeboaphelidium protococcarum]|nr:hypothetical protein MP228_009222 [Amoeboaphelidium protococcarum]